MQVRYKRDTKERYKRDTKKIFERYKRDTIEILDNNEKQKRGEEEARGRKSESSKKVWRRCSSSIKQQLHKAAETQSSSSTKQ